MEFARALYSVGDCCVYVCTIQFNPSCISTEEGFSSPYSATPVEGSCGYKCTLLSFCVIPDPCFVFIFEAGIDAWCLFDSGTRGQWPIIFSKQCNFLMGENGMENLKWGSFHVYVYVHRLFVRKVFLTKSFHVKKLQRFPSYSKCKHRTRMLFGSHAYFIIYFSLCTRRCMKTWNGWGRSGVNANCGEHCTARESIAHGLIIKAINYAIASTVAGHIWVKWKMKTRLRCRSQFKVRFFFFGVENVCGLMCCVGWTEAQTFSTAVVVKFSFFFSSWNGPGWEEPGFVEVDPRDSPFFHEYQSNLSFALAWKFLRFFIVISRKTSFLMAKKAIWSSMARRKHHSSSTLT